jgi:two-component system sensor histidine kinase PilS (NtrC family)
MQQPTSDILGKRTFRGSREALLQRAVEEPDLTWRVVTTLNLFRILIGAALLAQFLAGGDLRIFGERLPTLFAATVSSYLVLAMVFGFSLRQRWVPVGVQAVFQALTDIVAVTLLMYASGGMDSGLGGLLVVFIGAISLAMPIQYPASLAAVATLAILGEEFVSQLGGGPSNYPAAGILGAIIFGMALAARPLARRIQASEALALQFGIDLKNLSDLNNYIVQHLRESIVVVDADRTIRLINSSAMQLLGASGVLQERPLADIAKVIDDYIVRWREDDAVSSHAEFQMAAGDGALIKAHLAPLGKTDRGGPVLIFLEDASLMNARVQQSKLASLGRLSASIAHEIRNPVGAMSHAAQLLAESRGMGEDDLRLTEIIQTHSSRVSGIIENVLQLSRREASKPERVALRPWLHDFQTEFLRTHELQEGELTVGEIDDDLEVRMDPGHLRQVMWNLCDNAVKYASETGGILVELQAGRLQGQGRPYLEVLDCGLGIDAATADRIFEPFYTERLGGTGLGLYISRELCELNHATLMYLDRPGGGSIFRIVFADPDRWEAQEDA